MKKSRNIHNLDTLDRELYRLELEAKNIEEKLDHNLDYLQKNYLSMTMNSVFCEHKNKNNDDDGFWKSFSKNKAFDTAINAMAGNIATKAAEALNGWMDKYFHKKND